MAQEPFRLAFAALKARVRALTIRTVAEANRNRHPLLEMYFAIAPDTPYNDFNKH